MSVKEQSLLDEMNLLASEAEDHGDIMVEMVLEQMEAEGLPSPDEEQMQDIKSYVRCNDIIHHACLDRIDFLRHRYHELTGSFPEEISGRYFPVLAK